MAQVFAAASARSGCLAQAAPERPRRRTHWQNIGQQLVSEDLLVFDGDVARPRICVLEKRGLHAWTKEASNRLEEREGTRVDASLLANAATGPTVDIGALRFLNARRRGRDSTLDPFAGPRPSPFRRKRLPRRIGQRELAALLGRWRGDHQDRSTPTKLYLPNGMEALDAAISRYTTNSAS